MHSSSRSICSTSGHFHASAGSLLASYNDADSILPDKTGRAVFSVEVTVDVLLASNV